jgi:hypothetical protein
MFEFVHEVADVMIIDIIDEYDETVLVVYND